MRNIQTLEDLHQLQNETYMYAAIVAIIIFALALLFAYLTPYQGGKDKSYVFRRIWLILCVVIGSLGFWIYNQTYVMGFIKPIAFQNQFATTNLTCLAITIGGSLLISLVVMLIFRHSKFGSILGKEKN